VNRLPAKVIDIQRLEHLTIVSFDFEGQTIEMMALEISEKLEIGTKVILGMKATKVILAKTDDLKMSISNQLSGVIELLSKGRLITSIILRVGNSTSVESIITAQSSFALNLQEGDQLKVLVNENDLSILEIL